MLHKCIPLTPWIQPKTDKYNIAKNSMKNRTQKDKEYSTWLKDDK